MEYRMKKVCYVLLMVFIIIMAVGCKSSDVDDSGGTDLEFTVVEPNAVPEKLVSVIEEKKCEEFKYTYTEGDYLYIVAGFGEQKTGGYSIKVNSLCATENTICFDCDLIGPSEGEAVNEMATYPYIVIKIEFMDKNVVFE